MPVKDGQIGVLFYPNTNNGDKPAVQAVHRALIVSIEYPDILDCCTIRPSLVGVSGEASGEQDDYDYLRCLSIAASPVPLY